MFHTKPDIIEIVWPVSVPSAVSSMLERLWPRLMPLTAGARSTLDPLSWGVDDVTSGGTLFSRVEQRVASVNRQPTHLALMELSWITYACVRQYICQEGNSRLKLGLWLGFGLSMGEGGGSRGGSGGALDGTVDPVIWALQALS